MPLGAERKSWSFIKLNPLANRAFFEVHESAATTRLHARTEEGVWHLTLDASALGHFVTVEADVPGRFSDNAFPLIPGAPAAITFTPAAPATPGRTPSFRLRDLHSATMAAP